MTSPLIDELEMTREYLERSSRCLTEADSEFAPSEGMMTVAQQLSHIAQTIDWFIEGAFRPEGFEMDFEAMIREVKAVTSLAAARQWVDRAFVRAVEVVGSKSDAEMSRLLPEGPVLGGQPRAAIIGAITDHTAHHRGALTVYSRLRGHVPAMPYMDEM